MNRRSAKRFLADVQAAGVRVIPMSVPEESGMLVRVMGPMAGYQVALKLKDVIAEQAGFGTPARVPGVERVCRGIAAAEELLEEKLGDGPPLAEILGSGLVLLASGGYGSAVQNLGTKILEGMGLVLPPFWDLLEFAHGGFQQFFLGPGTAIALTRTGALRETEWMSRVPGDVGPQASPMARTSCSLGMAVFRFRARGLFQWAPGPVAEGVRERSAGVARARSRWPAI